MKNFFKAVVASALVVASSSALADSIKLVLPYSGTGTGAKFANVIVPEMKKLGWDVEVVAAGTCANAAHILKTASGPVISMWMNKDLSNPAPECAVPAPAEDNLIGIVYYAPDFICRIGDNTPSIFDATGPVTLSSQPLPYQSQHMLDAIQARSKATIKPIFYRNSGAQSTAAAAKETDYIIGTVGKSLEENGTAKCDYNTGTTSFAGTQSLAVAFDDPSLVAYMLQYLFAINLPQDQLEQMRADYSKVLASAEFAGLLEARKLINNTAGTDISYQLELIAK